MMALLQRSMVAVALLAAALAGCAAAPLGDTLPHSMGGLPDGAPARPNASRQYPLIHDMPTPRSAQPLSEEDAFKLEKELQAARDKQAKEATEEPPIAQPEPPPPPAKKAAPAPKKQAGPGNTAPSAAAKTSGAKTNP